MLINKISEEKADQKEISQYSSLRKKKNAFKIKVNPPNDVSPKTFAYWNYFCNYFAITNTYNAVQIINKKYTSAVGVKLTLSPGVPEPRLRQGGLIEKHKCSFVLHGLLSCHINFIKIR